jgi:DNA-binding response OmpR family regulator
MVILDIMMPGTNGIDICKQIRSISKVPIIMLTAKESEMDYSIGITSGSDDYMIKPFSPSILMMRIKALFRRIDLERESAKENVIENLSYGDISYSESRHAIICDNKNLGLTEMELDFLKYMLKRSDEAISREDFLNDLWGLDSDTETRVVDETVRRLRRKLRQAQSRVTINTVWGYGYQLGEVL